MATRLLALAALWLLLALAREAGGADQDGSSTTVTLSFENPGTREETTADLDGVPLTYPEDEADVMDLLRPALAKFRATRQAQAAEELLAIRETLVGEAGRERRLERVRGLLGASELSPGAADAYERALEETDVLLSNWEQWSGDFSRFHLYNHATAAPFRKGEDRIEFEEIHLAREDHGFTISFDPPFFTLIGAGIGAFDPRAARPGPMKLDLLNPALPGNSAEAVAGDLERMLDTVSQTLRQLAIQGTRELAQLHLIESLLRHEMEAGFFAAEAPAAITRGVARFYLIAHQINAMRGSPDLQGKITQLAVFPLPGERDAAAALIDRIAGADPLAVADPELADGAARAVALGLLRMAQSDPDGAPLWQHLAGKGIAPPLGGFDGPAFSEALARAYPGSGEQLAEAREEVVRLARSASELLFGKAEEPETAAPRPSIRLTGRGRATVGGFTFDYPEELEDAVAALAPGWAEGLRQGHRLLEERFPHADDEIQAPPELDDACLDAIRGLGLEVDRGMADAAAQAVSLAANGWRLGLPFFKGTEIQIHLHESLKALLEGGAEVEGFSLSGDGEKIAFEFRVKFSPEDPAWRSAGGEEGAPKPLPIPVVAKLDGDPRSASLEEQTAALREGADFIDFIEKIGEAAGEVSAEAPGSGDLTRFTGEQSWFIAVHELVEAALISRVIGSRDRRWFCDGVANVVAIRECDRRFGPGEGERIFASLFPPGPSEALAGDVDLRNWPAVENDPSAITQADALGAASYYFATRVIQQALENRGDALLAEWIAKIRQTPWNRTNTETVAAAYRELTGEDILELLDAP